MNSAQKVIAKAMSEKELFENVRDMLDTFGWRWTHFRPARTAKGWVTPLSGHQGFPDLVAVRDRTLLCIELKRESQQPSRLQEQWLSALHGAGGESYTPYGAKVYVWRPSDLLSGEVESVLGVNA